MPWQSDLVAFETLLVISLHQTLVTLLEKAPHLPPRSKKQLVSIVKKTNNNLETAERCSSGVSVHLQNDSFTFSLTVEKWLQTCCYAVLTQDAADGY